MAKPRREAEKPTEVLSCLVLHATPDGYVVGRGLVDASLVEWLSPTHVRPFEQTRPKDVRIPALKQANLGGETELKPARLAKGVPVMQQVGWHVVFGEMLEAAALRARTELRSQFDALVKKRRSHWRHLCPEQLRDELPLWASTPNGEDCPKCRASQTPKSKAVAA